MEKMSDKPLTFVKGKDVPDKKIADAFSSIFSADGKQLSKEEILAYVKKLTDDMVAEKTCMGDCNFKKKEVE